MTKLIERFEQMIEDHHQSEDDVSIIESMWRDAPLTAADRDLAIPKF